jgi:hypothetical protein
MFTARPFSPVMPYEPASNYHKHTSLTAERSENVDTPALDWKNPITHLNLYSNIHGPLYPAT